MCVCVYVCVYIYIKQPIQYSIHPPFCILYNIGIIYTYLYTVLVLFDNSYCQTAPLSRFLSTSLLALPPPPPPPRPYAPLPPLPRPPSPFSLSRHLFSSFFLGGGGGGGGGGLVFLFHVIFQNMMLLFCNVLL